MAVEAALLRFAVAILRKKNKENERSSRQGAREYRCVGSNTRSRWGLLETEASICLTDFLVKL